jgi:hypothetical protein
MAVSVTQNNYRGDKAAGRSAMAIQMDENLRQVVAGVSLRPVVGDGKRLNCTVVKSGKWYYSGSLYAVIEFSPCVGGKGFLRLDLTKLKTFERLNQAIDRAFANRFFLVEYCSDPVKTSNAVETWTDWGNGWRWEEGKHPSQAEGFRVEANSSYVRLMKAHNNNMPTDVCYFSKRLEDLPYV